MSSGTFCLVLHTHLPWLARHGAWPVGEEWLHQAWATAYAPVIEVLQRLAGQGRRDLLTLGVTPVIAAQLDDPYCLREQHTWLGYWQARAEGLGASRRDPVTASREFRASQAALHRFEEQWSRGGSPVLRALADAGAIEILGGPLTHPFQPLLRAPIRQFALRAGQDDAMVRRGHRPVGLWAPECGYAPGMEQDYAAAGIGHVLVDGPTMLRADRSTGSAWTIGDSDVVAFGRDLDVTYRVWSPRRGYPGGPWYRDFHTFDHEWGFRPARVTSTRIPSHEKAPYDADRARAAVEADAIDFVTHVRERLRDRELVVAAYDTELFGHWWHEGPLWLERVLCLLPEAGVQVTTLREAVDRHVAGRVDLPAGSWGSGKDWRVWDGERVEDMVAANDDAQAAVLAWLRDRPRLTRDRIADAAVRELMLALSSDWAFMVTKDSAADYARGRAAGHHARLRAILRAEDPGETQPFPHLDARLLYP